MNKKIYLIASLVLIILSACDCPCPVEEAEYEPLCIIHQDPIIEFNSSTTFTGTNAEGEREYDIDPSFNLEGFEFDSDANSGGSNPANSVVNTDGLYAISDFVEFIADFDGNGNKKYFAAYVSREPSNNIIRGDFIVPSISYNPALPANSVAELRVKGKIARLPLPLPTAASDEFCEYLETNVTDIDIAEARLNAVDFNQRNLPNILKLPATLVEFGEKAHGLNGPNTTNLDPATDIAIFGGNKEVALSYPASTNDPDYPLPADVNAALLEQAFIYHIDITVAVGDVYYYQSVNGREYILTIADIGQQSRIPFKLSLTIMFDQI